MCNVYLHRGYMGICIKVEDHNQGQGSNASYTHASRSRVKDIGIISAFIHASCVHATCIMDICIMVGYIPHGYKHHDTCLMDTSIMDLCSVGEEVERRCWSTLSGSLGLSARRTKSRGPKGLHLEVGARRAP